MLAGVATKETDKRVFSIDCNDITPSAGYQIRVRGGGRLVGRSIELGKPDFAELALQLSVCMCVGVVSHVREHKSKQISRMSILALINKKGFVIHA